MRCTTYQLGWPSLSNRRLDSRLKLFGKAVAGRVTINTDGLVQPSRSTRHSYSDHPCSSYWCLNICSSHEPYAIGTLWIETLGWNSSLILQLSSLVANAMHPSGNWQSPLLGIYRSTEDTRPSPGSARPRLWVSKQGLGVQDQTFWSTCQGQGWKCMFKPKWSYYISTSHRISVLRMWKI